MSKTLTPAERLAAKKPKRLQRRRVKGWRMPQGAISVTRPGLFGNPFRGERAVEAYREWLLRVSSSAGLVSKLFGCELSSPDLRWRTAQQVTNGLPTLRGHDLACFCAPGSDCHADVLLEMANE